MNFIIVNGERIKIGPTPAIILHCGFRNRAEVLRAASKNSSEVPSQRLSVNVVDWFKEHYGISF